MASQTSHANHTGFWPFDGKWWMLRVKEKIRGLFRDFRIRMWVLKCYKKSAIHFTYRGRLNTHDLRLIRTHMIPSINPLWLTVAHNTMQRIAMATDSRDLSQHWWACSFSMIPTASPRQCGLTSFRTVFPLLPRITSRRKKGEKPPFWQFHGCLTGAAMRGKP